MYCDHGRSEKRTSIRRISLGVLIAALLVGAAPAAAQPSTVCQEKDYSEAVKRVLAMEPMELLRACLRKSETLDQFTQVFTKRERIKGVLNPTETMFVKCRAKPASVYMKWLTNPYKGREVIFVEGKNDGKSLVHHYAGPLNVFLKIDPFGARVQKRSRRPVTRAGVRNGTKALLELSELALQRGHMKLTTVGVEQHGKRQLVVLERLLEKHPDYAVHKTTIYIDPEQMLPIKVVGCDWNGALQWAYEAKSINTNIKLTDKDFDPKNARYNFPDGVVDICFRLPWPFRRN